MGKTYLKLQKSEIAVVGAASTIYAAYIQAGSVNESNADEYLQRALKEAVRLSATVERVIIAENEVDSLES